jgi:hypothetical protein
MGYRLQPGYNILHSIAKETTRIAYLPGSFAAFVTFDCVTHVDEDHGCFFMTHCYLDSLLKW